MNFSKVALICLVVVVFINASVLAQEQLADLPEMKLLGRRTGKWEENTVVKTPARPDGVLLKSVQQGRWTMGGRYLEVKNVRGKYESTVLASYIPRTKEFHHWFFDSDGRADHWVGKLTESGDSIEWKMPVADGVVWTSYWNFKEDGTIELTGKFHNKEDRLILDIQRNLSRLKSPNFSH